MWGIVIQEKELGGNMKKSRLDEGARSLKKRGTNILEVAV